MEQDQEQLLSIASDLGIPLTPGWQGVDAVWPLVELIRHEGAVVVIKVDGERAGPDDNGPYTAIVTGTRLVGGPIRTDAESVEAALTRVLCEYARRMWGSRDGLPPRGSTTSGV
ncbi:MAG: hypothetical protein ACI8PZ_004783 [Myxococcota bacterium]|jgi:hypothetical protein